MADEHANDWEAFKGFMKEIDAAFDKQKRAKYLYDREVGQQGRVKIAFERSYYNDDAELAATTELTQAAMAQAMATAKEKAAAKYSAASLDAANEIRALRVLLPGMAAKACIALMMVADDVETAPA